MDEDIIVTLKRSNDLLMTFGNDYSDVFLPAIDEINRLRNTAKEFNLMRRGLECIANSEDTSVPNYVRKFAHVILGKELVVDIVERLTSHWGGERCVDVSIDVADAIDEIKRLRDVIKVQANAVQVLHEAEMSELNRLRKTAQEAYAAKATLDSEREANKILTDEIERLRDALADIANIVNPYEDGDTMQEIAREALKEKK